MYEMLQLNRSIETIVFIVLLCICYRMVVTSLSLQLASCHWNGIGYPRRWQKWSSTDTVQFSTMWQLETTVTSFERFLRLQWILLTRLVFRRCFNKINIHVHNMSLAVLRMLSQLKIFYYVSICIANLL